MARGVAQAPLVASFDLNISNGILGPYWAHVSGIDCVVEFNAADLAIRRLWAPVGGCRVALLCQYLYGNLLWKLANLLLTHSRLRS